MMQPEQPGCCTSIFASLCSRMHSNSSPYSGDATAEEYAHLERRIRSLSTAIWYTGVQPRPNVSSRKEPRARGLRAYRGLATLLTMNSSSDGAVVVTGGPPTSSALSLTVVATRQMNPEHDSALPSMRRRTSHSNFSHQRPLITVHRISASNKSWKDLSDDVTSAPVDLSVHIADVLRSLTLMSMSMDTVKDRLMMYRFVLSRCWHDFKARIDAAQHLLNFPASMSLTRILRGWQPQSNDGLTSYGTWEHVKDPNLGQILKHEGVPMALNQNAVCFQLSIYTASRWTQVLCKAVEDLEEATNLYASSQRAHSQLTTMAQRIMVLALLLDCQSIKTIFRLNSFQNYLSPYDKRQSRRHINTDIASTAYMLNIRNDERKQGESRGEHILRYLDSLLAWYHAATNLPSAIARLGDKLPVVHIVYVPVLRSREPKRMYSPVFVARKEMNKFLTGEIEHAYTKRELAEFDAALDELFLGFPTPSGARNSRHRSNAGPPMEDFIGGIHGESLTLSVVNGDPSLAPSSVMSPIWSMVSGRSTSNRQSTYPPAFPTQMSAEHFVKPSDGNLGLPSRKRCCYCCSLLDEVFQRIAHSHGWNPDSDLGESSSDDSLDISAYFKPDFGFLVPWTPPPIGYGVSLRALRAIERELRGLLMAGITNHLEPVFSRTEEARANFGDQEIEAQAGGSSQQGQKSWHSGTRSPVPPLVSEASEGSSHRGQPWWT